MNFIVFIISKMRDQARAIGVEKTMPSILVSTQLQGAR